MNKSIDNYFVNGCMRCPLGATQECKIHTWRETLLALQDILRKSSLKEEVKWGVPCYTFEGKNVILLSALKDFACMSFLKGAWINDPYNLLEKQGNYVQHGRIIKFYNLTEVELRYEKLLSYIQNAVDVEKSDFDRNHNPLTIPYPDELVQKLSHDPAFAAAFYGLTPGRQKGYVIFFSQPKQSQTRISRIEKATSDIMAGIGLHDHYKKKRS